MAWRDQLRTKRIARGAEAIAARAGLVDAPWARKNVHAWQAVMCGALARRSEGVHRYLRMRAMRGAHG